MNILANVIALGLALAPGDPLFDQVSVELGLVPIATVATPAGACVHLADPVSPSVSLGPVLSPSIDLILSTPTVTLTLRQC